MIPILGWKLPAWNEWEYVVLGMIAMYVALTATILFAIGVLVTSITNPESLEREESEE